MSPGVEESVGAEVSGVVTDGRIMVGFYLESRTFSLPRTFFSPLLGCIHLLAVAEKEKGLCSRELDEIRK